MTLPWLLYSSLNLYIILILNHTCEIEILCAFSSNIFLQSLRKLKTEEYQVNALDENLTERYQDKTGS